MKTYGWSSYLSQVLFPAVCGHGPPQLSEQLHMELHQWFRNCKAKQEKKLLKIYWTWKNFCKERTKCLFLWINIAKYKDRQVWVKIELFLSTVPTSLHRTRDCWKLCVSKLLLWCYKFYTVIDFKAIDRIWSQCFITSQIVKNAI